MGSQGFKEVMIMTKVIYGHIENTKDIGRINRKIRSQIRSASTRSRITELKKRSRYLIVLTHSPGWKKKYNIGALRRRAQKEYAMTTKVANERISKVCKSCKPYKV